MLTILFEFLLSQVRKCFIIGAVALLFIVLNTFVFGGLYEAITEGDINPDALWASLLSLAALATGGIASIAGMWMGRDSSAPARNVRLMSLLIVSAVFVGGVHSYLDSEEVLKKEADLTRIIAQITEIAVSSGDSAIASKLADIGHPISDGDLANWSPSKQAAPPAEAANADEAEGDADEAEGDAPAGNE